MLSPSSFSTFISVALAVLGLCFGKIADITPDCSSLKSDKSKEVVVLGREGITSSGRRSLVNSGISRNVLEAVYCNTEI